MLTVACFEQRKRPAERAGRALGIITNHRQAAAPLGTIHREHSDHGVSAPAKAPLSNTSRRRSFGRFGQEMKRGTVVPNVVALARLPCVTSVVVLSYDDDKATRKGTGLRRITDAACTVATVSVTIAIA